MRRFGAPDSPYTVRKVFENPFLDLNHIQFVIPAHIFGHCLVIRL